MVPILKVPMKSLDFGEQLYRSESEVVNGIKETQLRNHVELWWTEKALQLSDPLKVLMSYHNQQCCDCFIHLALNVLNAYFMNDHNRMFVLPHNNSINKNTIRMMEFMELYKFTS